MSITLPNGVKVPDPGSNWVTDGQTNWGLLDNAIGDVADLGLDVADHESRITDLEAAPGGTVDPADLISTDADNALVQGSDDKLYVAESIGGGAQPLIAARYTRGTAQTIPDGSETAMGYTTAVFDTHSACSTSGGWSFTCPAGGAGIYAVSAAVTIADPANTTTYTRLQLLLTKNDVTYTVLGRDYNDNTDLRGAAGGPALIDLAEDDVVRIVIAQDSGASRNTLDAHEMNWVNLWRIGVIE